jgi:SNF2 family DNA or RNA helicase
MNFAVQSLQTATWSPMASVVGELNRDGDRIVIMASGTDYAAVAAATRKVQLMTFRAEPTDPPGALILPYSWPACIQLAFGFGEHWYPQGRLLQRIRAEIHARTDPIPDALSYQLPQGLKARSYQVAGAHEIARTGSAVITDEPRTGKTITTILGLRELHVRGRWPTPIVCVVPAGTIDQWVEAFELWWPDVLTVPWRGTSRKRKYEGKANVYVTSYETAIRDAAYAISSGKKAETTLLRLQPKTLVVDELHYIANPTAKRSLACIRLGLVAEHFIGLGGTPIKKHVGDFWSTLACLVNHAWPAREPWYDRYIESVPGDYGRPKVLGLAPYRQAEWDMLLLGQYRRVTRREVLPELPEQFWTIRTVEIPKAWRKAYDDFEQKMIAVLPDTEEELKTFDVQTQFTHLTMLASSGCDVEYEPGEKLDRETGELVPVTHTHLYPKAPAWKVDELLRILAEREDDQVLIYCPYTRLLELAGMRVAEVHGADKVAYIQGGQSAKARTAARKGFQSGQIQYLLCSTGAGGVGLTLTAAGTIVHLQRSLSMVDAKQADDRSSGIGSEIHDAIEIIDIVAVDTVESRVREILSENAGQLGALLKDPTVVKRMLGGLPTPTEHQPAKEATP